MQHRHQELGQDNHNHYVICANNNSTHKRLQLFTIAKSGDKYCYMCKGEYIPEQGKTGANKPKREGERLWLDHS